MAIYPADGLAIKVLRPLHDIDAAVDVARVVQDIRNIAEGICERLDSAAAPGDILFTLNDQLFNVLDFHCSPLSLAEPHHSQLNRVLQQRYGEPLSLGILYICVGRWLGLALTGCDFPGRFLVHYHDEKGGVIIDPAAGGVQLQEEDLLTLLKHRFGAAAGEVITGDFLSDVDDSYLVVRLLRRLKQAYMKQQETVRALRVQNKIMQLVPDVPGGFRERGELYELLGCPRAAAENYSRYLDLVPDAGDAISLHQHLSQLLSQPQVLH
ncbi:MAG: tetratricopeptide repeat protein [Pseudomonadota bacterium]